MSSGLYSTEKREFDTTLDLTKLRPYGDTMNDGKVQMSFTLPVPCNEKGVEAALELARKMGFVNPAVAFSEALDKEFSFYVVYGATSYNVDYTAIKVQALEIDTMDMHECEKYIEENFDREVVMVGASTGTDAHTVGIDAIMNMKGYAGHYGLERYKGVRAYNLGSQVPNEEFIKKAIELKADALLVSQTVTQKDVHIENLTNQGDNLEKEREIDHWLYFSSEENINIAINLFKLPFIFSPLKSICYSCIHHSFIISKISWFIYWFC